MSFAPDCTALGDGSAPEGQCAGRRATIVDELGGGKLVCTAGRDVIAAGGGRDRVKGRGGKDVVCGGAGKGPGSPVAAATTGSRVGAGATSCAAAAGAIGSPAAPGAIAAAAGAAATSSRAAADGSALWRDGERRRRAPSPSMRRSTCHSIVPRACARRSAAASGSACPVRAASTFWSCLIRTNSLAALAARKVFTASTMPMPGAYILYSETFGSSGYQVLGQQDVGGSDRRGTSVCSSTLSTSALSSALPGVVLLAVGEPGLGVGGHDHARLGAVDAGLERAGAGRDLAPFLHSTVSLAQVPDVAVGVLRVPIERVLDHVCRARLTRSWTIRATTPFAISFVSLADAEDDLLASPTRQSRDRRSGPPGTSGK